jgi:arsenite oxidase small subunit
MHKTALNRRGFVKACGAAAMTAAVSGRLAPPAFALEDAPRLKLVDKAGDPIKAGTLEVGANYIFLYPYVSTPCLLLRLGAPTRRDVTQTGRDEAAYTWPGGAGADGAVVAYSAICSHLLTYDSTARSFLTYNQGRSKLSGAQGAITCCAHASAFDPANGAKVVTGPATFPLAAVGLDYDPASDELTAVGLVGTAVIDKFFEAYRGDLNAEYGRGAYRALLEDTTTVLPIGEYSRQVVRC